MLRIAFVCCISGAEQEKIRQFYVLGIQVCLKPIVHMMNIKIKLIYNI